MADRRLVTLAGVPLGPSRHICAFFHDRAEELRVLLPFIREGLQQGDKVFLLVAPSQRSEYVERLKQGDAGIEAALRSGQLEVSSPGEALRGHFDVSAMLRLIQGILDQGKVQGYPLTRLVINMDWTLDALPGRHAIVECEASLNDVLRPYDDPVICTYDTANFGGGIVIDAMRTHRMVIVGGVLRENPFYVPPDEFLKEMRSRTS
jgi:hypothetical protein